MSTPPAVPLMKDVIPADLHDRGYVKDWLEKPWTPEAQAEVFKKLDGAETLIGRKIGIPDDKAKPEEVEKFYGSLRPAKADDYEIKVGEGADAEFIKEFRTAAHHAGMSKAQVSRQLEKLIPVFQANAKKQADAVAAQEKDFDEIVKAAFGSENEAVLKRAQDAMKEHAPDNLKPHVPQLDNKALAILSGVINAIMLKYVPEDQLKAGGGGGGGANDKEALLKEATALQSSKAWNDFRHPDHQKTVARVTEIFAQPAFKS